MNSNERLIEQVQLLRCQMGDRDAFAGLIERYEAPLRYFIGRMLNDAEVTEDIFQDTWLKVIRKIHTLKKVDSFKIWLYSIARNNVYQHLRKEKTSSQFHENIAVSNDIEEEVFSTEDAVEIHRCLEKLRPEHKDVLMLRFLEQMSYEQIAQVLSCNLGTVKSRIYYAKRALKTEMENKNGK